MSSEDEWAQLKAHAAELGSDRTQLNQPQADDGGAGGGGYLVVRQDDLGAVGNESCAQHGRLLRKLCSFGESRLSADDLGQGGIASQAARWADRYGGYLLAVLATLIWSGNLVTARGLRDSVPPVSLAFWRCVIAVVAVLPWTVGRLRAELPAVRGNMRPLSFLGLSGIAAYTIMVYVAGHTTAATNMSLLAVSASVFILLLSRALREERMGWQRIAGSVVALAGVATLVSGGSLSAFTPHPGDLWMLGATLIFAYYSLRVRELPAGLSGTTVLLSTFLCALACLLPAYLVELALRGGFEVTLPVFASLGYVGAMSSAAAYFCWNSAVGRIGAARAGFLYYLLPAFTALLSFWLLGETVTGAQVASMVLIVTGVLLALLAAGRAKGPRATAPSTTSGAARGSPPRNGGGNCEPAEPPAGGGRAPAAKEPAETQAKNEHGEEVEPQ